VAEGALQFQSLGGEGAGGRAEKLKLGKQKAKIARRRAQRSAAPSCLPIFLFLAPCLLNAPGFRFPPSGSSFPPFSFSAFYFAYPGVETEFGHGEKLVAGLCDRVFHSHLLHPF
jgi:hypothetical protein